jgi:putative colanic acid biosynthesis acetyltransferase WcaF
MSDARVDISYCPSPHSFKNKVARVLWKAVWLFLFRPSPTIFHGWRRFLLRLFGARIDKSVHVYPSVKIWAPWNLTMSEHSCLAPYVDCYCVAPIVIGAHSTVSQYSYLCAASHDFENPKMPLITSPIIIEEQAWIGADAFIALGVKIGQGAVIGARTSVFKDVQPWIVVGGNPAKFIKKRELKSISKCM